MAARALDERFYRYQVRAIRRFQRLHTPQTPEDFECLALEWVNRHAAKARSRWELMTNSVLKGCNSLRRRAT